LHKQIDKQPASLTPGPAHLIEVGAIVQANQFRVG
jgi:hypothetical protein